MAKNPMGKARKVTEPFLTVTDGLFTWKVLKAYSNDPDKLYARWFCAVSSPYTGGGYDMGDTYIAEVTGTLVQRDPDVPDEALPTHLKGGPVQNPNPLDALLGGW